MKDTKITAAQIAKVIQEVMVIKNPSYPIVKDKKGKIVADPDLKDTENIPWDVDFGDYMRSEVLPYAPETWIDETVIDNKYGRSDNKIGVVGTNISFNKFFYHYEVPRNPDEIAKEIFELERSLEGFLEEFL